MTKSLLLAAAIPALLLGACSGTRNRGLESVHQPVVERQDYALDLYVQGNRLTPGEGQRLAGWFGSLGLGYGDQVAVDDAGHDGVRPDVGALLARSGLLLSPDVPAAGPPIAPGTVRVVVSRARAGVRGCPDWSRDPSHDFESHTSSNYGCSVNGNVAAMIADPNDLVRGQTNAGNDPRVSFRAIEAYRKATPTGSGGTATQSTSTGGK